MNSSCLSVPDLAARWAVPTDKVLSLIRAGELAAVNLALRQVPAADHAGGYRWPKSSHSTPAVRRASGQTTAAAEGKARGVY